MGEVFSLAAAIIWATAVLFLRKSGESVSPFALNLFRVTFTLPLFFLTLAAAGQRVISDAALSDYLVLFASGIIAIAISDTLFHLSLNLIGAGLSAITGCVYSPLVTVMAFMLLGEQLGPWQFAGMGLVAAAVVVAARHRPPEGASVRQIVVGILWGVLAMASVAFGIVIAKPVLLRTPVVWATTMRQVGALAAMIPVALLLPARRRLFAVFRPSGSWRFSVPATLLGSYLALIAWIAGMKYTMTGTAAILNQTSTIFILLLATVFLREPITRRKVIASALAIAGIFMVTFSPPA
jgi:drug/metabolite transporter (DMT)-like permease